jgi:NAD(P)-dependent dehydrogenase (short-subunit alcohol dehydrogenase family)
MKIAVTGGTAGIAQALGNLYEQDDHLVVRLSRRTGHNIRVIPKTADAIESCDVFINNAQAGFAQTELLFEMARRWEGTGKRIISISSMLTLQPTCNMPGMSEYYVQKLALELAHKELKSQQLGIRFVLVRPGNIATSPNKTVPPARDLLQWSQFLFELLELDSEQLALPEINLG